MGENGNAADNIIAQAEKDAALLVESVLSDAEVQKNAIIDEARAEVKSVLAIINDEKKAAISAAHEEKKAIFDDAQKKVLSMYGEVGTYSLAQNADFAEKIQKELQNTQTNIMSLADGIKYSFFRQTALELIALYNIIHASYTYHLPKSEDSGNDDYKNCADNVKGFTEQIAETLSCNGVNPYFSAPGEPFNGLIHEAADKKQSFDPKTAAVLKSVRLGFADGGGIIQKEIVQISEQ